MAHTHESIRLASEAQGLTQRCHDPYLRCALYGAAQVALGIKGCCVLSHSPQGCFQLIDAAFSWQDADYTETLTLCTKLCEDEIVHGGEELLTRTVLEARDFDIPVLFIVTSCGPEIVGDDILVVSEDMSSQVDFQIVPIQCAGFRGDQNQGADIALDAILKHIVGKEDKNRNTRRIPNSVCLIAPHANANPSWVGDLTWVKTVLSEMGATIIATLTHDTPLDDLCKIPEAEGSILLSHDAGQKAADYMSECYGIDQWCKGLPLPMGFTNIRRWLTELGNRLNAGEKAKELIAEGETRVVELCRRKGLEQSGMHRATAGIVADATVGIPLLRFITEDLEMIPNLVCLRSESTTTREMLERELTELGLDTKIVYKADVYQAKMGLQNNQPEIVFGSNIERHAIEDLDIPFIVRLVNPISQFRIIDREYFGYFGMLNLIEYIQNERLEKYRSKKRRYKARW